jgi:hypothetical protein
MFRLRAEGKGTVVTLDECAFGKVDDKGKASLQQGWKLLLEGCLRVFAETGAPPRPWPGI